MISRETWLFIAHTTTGHLVHEIFIWPSSIEGSNSERENDDFFFHVYSNIKFESVC